MINQASPRRRGLPAGAFPARRRSLHAALGICLLLVAGCSPSPEPQGQPRPVRIVQVQTPPPQPAAGFAGEIRARRETRLAFRIGGKLAARLVEIGDRVRKGQLVAQLESSDDRLAVRSLRAQLNAAKADRDFGRADLERYRELLRQSVITQPEWDRHEAAYTAARERVDALEAQLAQAGNRLDYTQLRAERDGVISGLQAEAGDVIAPGQPVALLAQVDEKDIVIQLPEQRVQSIRPGLEVSVQIGAEVQPRIKARIREIAPTADPLTRTYQLKASLLEGLNRAALGMTATLWLPALQTEGGLAVPRSAVFSPLSEPSQTRVWTVDPERRIAASRRVILGPPLSEGLIQVSGVNRGEWVVTAGVQRLTEGAAVKLLGFDTQTAAADKTPPSGKQP